MPVQTTVTETMELQRHDTSPPHAKFWLVIPNDAGIHLAFSHSVAAHAPAVEVIAEIQGWHHMNARRYSVAPGSGLLRRLMLKTVPRLVIFSIVSDPCPKYCLPN